MAGLATENEDLSTGDEDVLGTVEVQPEPPPADDDDDDEESTPEAGRPPRKERRAARAAAHRELQENQRRLEQQLQEERMARARMEGLMEENLRRQQQTGPHPLEVERDKIMRLQEEHFNNFANNAAKMSPEERNAATQRARELEQEKHDVMFRLAAARNGLGQQNPQQAQQLAQQQALRAALDARYPDIAADPKATALGGLIWRQLLLEGKPDNWDTADEAAEETRRRRGMPSRNGAPRPTAAQKSKFVAAPKGPSGGGGGAESGPIRITKAQAQMAENMYPTLSAAKAHQKWWNTYGKKHA